jgi:hypothetical protein
MQGFGGKAKKKDTTAKAKTYVGGKVVPVLNQLITLL